MVWYDWQEVGDEAAEGDEQVEEEIVEEDHKKVAI